MKTLLLCLLLTGSIQVGYTQQPDTARLYRSIKYLASDRLQGRLPGTKGEKKAAGHLKHGMKHAGLSPGAPEGWYQFFEFAGKPALGRHNQLILETEGEKVALGVGRDWYPLAVSANLDGQQFGKVMNGGYGILDSSLARNDFKGLTSAEIGQSWVLIDLGLPENLDPHTSAKWIGWRPRLDAVKAYHPAGIVFFNSNANLNPLNASVSAGFKREKLPMIWVNDSIAEMMKKGIPKINCTVDLEDVLITARNVVGYINNSSENTIVIGAHYDHLGHGEWGHSLAPGSNEIHNGADDNASGAAVVVEVGRRLAKLPLKNYNLVFVTFSGEEEGLLGSNYFVKNMPENIGHISAMINLDMVGRLDSALIVSGTGTSPSWDSIVQVSSQGIPIKTSAGGVGSSDHTSFYLSGIPAIHLFTGTHADYHKPEDDWQKINYSGVAKVTDIVVNICTELDKRPPLTFTKTAEPSASTSTFRVTLGIVPDYLYSGKGLRVDGTSPGRPAEKAGLKRGDIITKLGEFQTDDINAYMQGLSLFSRGETIAVTIIRGGQEMVLPLTF